MAHIAHMVSLIVARNLRLLQPQQFYYQQIFRYSEKIYEAGKAKENVHFLKTQREQLKELRSKILKERDVIKERIQQLDQQIENIKKKNNERENQNNSTKL